MTACPVSPYNPRLCFAVDNSGQLGCETLTYVAATRSTFPINSNVSHAQMLQFVLLLLSLAHKSKSHAPVVKLPPPPTLWFLLCLQKILRFAESLSCALQYAVYIIPWYILYARACDVSPDARHLSRHLG